MNDNARRLTDLKAILISGNRVGMTKAEAIERMSKHPFFRNADEPTRTDAVSYADQIQWIVTE